MGDDELTRRRTSFLELSSTLLAEEQLPAADASDLLQLLESVQADEIAALLAAWTSRPGDRSADAWLRERIWKDPDLRATAMDVTATWLFGTAFRRGQVAAADEATHDLRARLAFRGQFWDLVKAHPPGLSGGYFGHWMYPAER